MVGSALSRVARGFRGVLHVIAVTNAPHRLEGHDLCVMVVVEDVGDAKMTISDGRKISERRGPVVTC